MQITPTKIEGVYIITPQCFEDARGMFFESFNQEKFFQALPQYQHLKFVQDNQSISKKGVLRGLHFQNPHPQGKLVRVVAGKILDVAVDIRPDSATYKQYFAIELDDQKHQQLWIAPGLAHGFLALEDSIVLYKTTDYWHAKADHCLIWNDLDINIDWPKIDGVDIYALSAKDEIGENLSNLTK